MVVAGGATRSASVRAGLAAVPDDAEVVLVHDAARPLAAAALFARVAAAVRAAPTPPCPSWRWPTRSAAATAAAVDRDELVAVQTPQGFRAAALRAAHAGGRGHRRRHPGRGGGWQVVVVRRRPANLKITDPADLVAAAALLGTGPVVTARAGAALRVGLGFDVHPFGDDPSTGRPLVLGGVRFAGGPGLAGHSDADAVAHACADALLGAAGLGDIGQHFPDTDPRWAGADSVGLLAEAAAAWCAPPAGAANVDCSVVLDAPKLAPAGPRWRAPLRRGRRPGHRQGRGPRAWAPSAGGRACLLRRRPRRPRSRGPVMTPCGPPPTPPATPETTRRFARAPGGRA